MIAMTTRSSINVNPESLFFRSSLFVFISDFVCAQSLLYEHDDLPFYSILFACGWSRKLHLRFRCKFIEVLRYTTRAKNVIPQFTGKLLKSGIDGTRISNHADIRAWLRSGP